MACDYKASSWKRDANSFQRYQDMFASFTTEVAKLSLIARMTEIQKRWPQYIKIEEIPTI